MAKAKKAAPKKAVSAKSAPKKAVAPIAKPAPSKSSTQTPNPVFNISEINELIHAVNHSNVNELKLKRGDFRITIRQGMTASTHVVAAPAPVHSAPMSAPAPVAAAPAPVAAAPVAESTENLYTIKSPMIGTFYRASGPGKPVFVNVGDEIKVGQVLCIVEAMKLFNEIESEVSGKIVKVLIDDSSPIEYDQPLFLVQTN